MLRGDARARPDCAAPRRATLRYAAILCDAVRDILFAIHTLR